MTTRAVKKYNSENAERESLRDKNFRVSSALRVVTIMVALWVSAQSLAHLTTNDSNLSRQQRFEASIETTYYFIWVLAASFLLLACKEFYDVKKHLERGRADEDCKMDSRYCVLNSAILGSGYIAAGGYAVGHVAPKIHALKSDDWHDGQHDYDSHSFEDERIFMGSLLFLVIAAWAFRGQGPCILAALDDWRQSIGEFLSDPAGLEGYKTMEVDCGFGYTVKLTA